MHRLPGKVVLFGGRRREGTIVGMAGAVVMFLERRQQEETFDPSGFAAIDNTAGPVERYGNLPAIGTSVTQLGSCRKLLFFGQGAIRSGEVTRMQADGHPYAFEWIGCREPSRPGQQREEIEENRTGYTGPREIRDTAPIGIPGPDPHGIFRSDACGPGVA